MTYDINRVYTPLETTFSGLQFCRIFIRLAVVAAQIGKSHKIPIKFDLTVFKGHPRSSILVSIESAHATSY